MNNLFRHLGVRMAVALTLSVLLISMHVFVLFDAIEADVGDEDAHLGFLGPDEEEKERGKKWITRNLVDGKVIQVCSEDYPIATPLAVERWNDALGITAFIVLEDHKDCDAENRMGDWRPQGGGVDDLIVSFAPDPLHEKAGSFLITSGQRNNTARLTAVASDSKHVGGGWLPVAQLGVPEAKALAVFVNSTAGRLQLLRNMGRTREFPQYRSAGLKNIRIPDLSDKANVRILADCWELTKDMLVPQFREGECEVRRLWDEAVAEAMGWDPNELTRLRLLLHREPHVRGLGYNQYADTEESA